MDFGYFGPPEEHTQWTASLGRRSGTYITPDNPSSEVCGEVAASFSAASIALKATDPAYAEELVTHARQMYDFGRKYPGSYMKSKVAGMKDHAKHYPSSNWHDEMAWGALWLHFATGVRHLLLRQLCSQTVAGILAVDLAHWQVRSSASLQRCMCLHLAIALCLIADRGGIWWSACESASLRASAQTLLWYLDVGCRRSMGCSE